MKSARKPHPALGVARGKVQVDDGPVGIVGGVHGEVKEAVDALIGAGVAEGPAGGIGLVTGYIEVDDGHGRLPRPLGRSEGWLGYETAYPAGGRGAMGGARRSSQRR